MPRDVLQIRMDAELDRALEILTRAWGGVTGPATRTAVVREAMRRAVAEVERGEETAPKKKTRKSL